MEFAILDLLLGRLYRNISTVIQYHTISRHFLNLMTKRRIAQDLRENARPAVEIRAAVQILLLRTRAMGDLKDRRPRPYSWTLVLGLSPGPYS